MAVAGAKAADRLPGRDVRECSSAQSSYREFIENTAGCCSIDARCLPARQSTIEPLREMDLLAEGLRAIDAATPRGLFRD